MQLWGTQSTGNITLLWAVLSQCGVRLVRKCCQSPGNEKCSLRHLVTFLRHRATFKYITLWLYHHFQGPYSVPETLICTLFNTLQQPVFFLIPKLQRFPAMLRRYFLAPFVMQENWFIESGSMFFLNLKFLAHLHLLAVIPVCLLICVPIRL